MMKRLDIIMGLDNVYDYAEFLAACKTRNIPRLPWVEYAQKVLSLNYGMALYPELAPLAAYMEYTKNNGDNLGEPVEVLQQPLVATKQGCSSCGGGKVR